MSSINKSHIHVAVAVIQGSDNRILIAKRPDHLHMGGLWEFPGGKVETSETVTDALARELQEELAIDADVDGMSPLICIEHDYGDKQVLLDVWYVRQFSGEPVGHEGQEVQWVDRQHLRNHEFPAANRAIVSAVELPEAMLITGEAEDVNDYLYKLSKALDAGVKLVQLRAKALDKAAYKTLALEASKLCQARDVTLMLNTSDHELIMDIGDGVHLDSTQLVSFSERPHLIPKEKLLSASCHNAHELAQAEKLGVDFVTLSPVAMTKHYKATEVLGWNQFAELSKTAVMPVYALGGMRVEDIAAAQKNGAQGIAAISAYWSL